MDELNRWQRYRAKDVDAYRKNKRDYAKTEDQRTYRREYMRKWREENRERHNELARESHAKHRVKQNKANRERHYLKRYGITLEQREIMIQAQDSRCNICKEVRKLHCDHDHGTGQLRGLICMRCNTMLGWYEKVTGNSIEKYLKGSNGQKEQEERTRTPES